MRFGLSLMVTFALLFTTATAFGAKHVLYIESYHAGYAWGDGITDAVKDARSGEDVILKIHRMDTKRNTSEANRARAAHDAKGVIDDFLPHVVIASDNNASTYLFMKYYEDPRTPFVFCGVNYTADSYGFAFSNVTGTVEGPPVTKLIYFLKHLTRVIRAGYLAGDTLTEGKDGAFTKRDVREAKYRTRPKNAICGWAGTHTWRTGGKLYV